MTLATYIEGAVTPSHTFTDIAKFYENLVPGVIPEGSLIAWEGRKVRLARKGDKAFSVQSTTYVIGLGDSALKWSHRYQRDEWGRIIYEKRPDPDWPRFIQDPAHPNRIPNPDHPVWDEVPVKDDDGKIIEIRKVVASSPFIPNPSPASLIPNPEAAPLEFFPVENPDFDPTMENVPRSKRPEEWTPVNIAGESHTRIDNTVSVNDYICPSNIPGRATASKKATSMVCMEITKPFDEGCGYGIALCRRDLNVGDT